MELPTSLRWASAVGLLALCLVVLGCKKDEPQNPLLACRLSNSGGGTGIGPGSSVNRTVMFWIAQDFGCGKLRLVNIRNTETQSVFYNTSGTYIIDRYSATQPACGTTGSMTLLMEKGYEYEYTIECTNRQWKGKFTADCSDDCLAIQLK